jgi:hypothetical protein
MPGGPGKAQLLYIDAAAEFSKYDSILMDPITAYAAADRSHLSSVPLDEMVALLNYLDASVRGQLQEDYIFVTKPGPQTMRLRIALTEAKGASVVLSAASSVTPAGLALNGLKKTVTGASTGVGSTGVEMELLDATSGKRLAAAVDERVGTKASSFGKWESAQEACDYWAAQLKARLTEFRAK